MTPGEIRKAAAAVAVPALVVLGAALLPDSPGGGVVTWQEWIAVAIAGLSTGTVVYAVPNSRRIRDTE